ncbi:MAG: hypothetical protein J2P20_00085 [Pseudonocardia sp.]|nr:hypothetical protein [Pseudonocardia sp.]
MSSAGRADRINARMRTRYAEARTELDRFSVAADYVRSAAKVAARTAPDRTDAALNGLVRRMLSVADELLERGKR